MNNIEFKNSRINRLLEEMDMLIANLELNINTIAEDQLVFPNINLSDYEIITDPDFEMGEWDFGSKSIISLKSGFSGSFLKAENIKLNGGIADRSTVIAENSVICQNCFGRIEAQYIMTGNIGTFNNKLLEKDKMDIIAKNNLIVQGKSYFAHVDAWNAEFYDLVRNSLLLIGRLALFNDIGNGTEIEINPLKTFFFNSLYEIQQQFKNRFNDLKRDKETAHNELMTFKQKMERSDHVDIDNIPGSLRVKIEKNKRMFNNLDDKYHELEKFFVNMIFESKIKRIEELINLLKETIIQKSFIIIKGKVEPVITVKFDSKTIYLVEDLRNIKIYIENDEIKIEKQ
jgi:hypothetical protein